MGTNRRRRDQRDASGNSPLYSGNDLPGINARDTDRMARSRPRPRRTVDFDETSNSEIIIPSTANENIDNATSAFKNLSLLGIYNSLLAASSAFVFLFPFFLVAECYDAYRASRRNLAKSSHRIEFLVKAASATLSALFILPILFVGAAVLTPILLVAAFSLRALYHLGSVVDSLFQQTRNWSKIADHSVGFLSNSLFAIAAGILLVGGGPFAWAGLGIIGAAAGLCYAGYKLYQGYQRWSDERRDRAVSEASRNIVTDGVLPSRNLQSSWFETPSAARGLAPAASPTTGLIQRNRPTIAAPPSNPNTASRRPSSRH